MTQAWRRSVTNPRLLISYKGVMAFTAIIAEDTEIIARENLFTHLIDTITMANWDGSNAHEIVSAIFRAMNTSLSKRADARLPRWGDAFLCH